MKIEYSDREFDNKTFNIVELEKEIIRRSNLMLSENEIEVKWKTEDSMQVFADEFYIDQVLTNYLVNAIRHSQKVEKDKYIEIKNEINHKNGKVRISVFNTGSNIDDENIEKIWNRFYRVDESRNRESGGTGIGLSIVKAIMNNYKNDFGVINRENGVEFFFELEQNNLHKT